MNIFDQGYLCINRLGSACGWHKGSIWVWDTFAGRPGPWNTREVHTFPPTSFPGTRPSSALLSLITWKLGPWVLLTCSVAYWFYLLEQGKLGKKVIDL